MKNIIVLCGGKSTEHEVSLRSARTVINCLDRSKYRVYAVFLDKEGRFVPLGKIDDPIESPKGLAKTSEDSLLASISKFASFVDTLDQVIVFPVIHGQSGEDGEIQGFLQSLNLTYVGNGIMSSALCMDKGYANQVLRESKLPKLPFYVLSKEDYKKAEKEELEKHIEEVCGLPCFVKAANGGSSLGVYRAEKENFFQAVEKAFAYDRRIVIEKEAKGIELEVSILGNENPKASLPGSYTSHKEVFDYDAKYNDESTIQNVPHPLSDEIAEQVQNLALQTYKTLGCEGLARVDIFMTPEGDLYINEINTLPGMTSISLAPKLWTELTDMTMSDYLDELIHYAEESRKSRSEIVTSWGNE